MHHRHKLFIVSYILAAPIYAGLMLTLIRIAYVSTRYLRSSVSTPWVVSTLPVKRTLNLRALRTLTDTYNFSSALILQCMMISFVQRTI
ncbi:hypothetical protein BDR04DRAFT_1093615 [Suillus decipiens]|nr:hypothetical protein BDR04DRAFT_1093615 [Suillus decipiens]